MKIIREVEGLKSNGHYALAIVEKGQVFLSGQFSVDPKSGEKKFGSIENEVNQVLNNIELILKQVKSDRNKILKVTIYISDINDWPAIDKEYAKFFSNHTPARTVVPVKELHYGFKVEIDVVAFCE
jgi:reactive intermediate/imine deaminase